MRLVSEQFEANPPPFWQIGAETWRAIMDTNVCGVFYMARCTIPIMLKRRKGRLINVSSSPRMMRLAGWSPYGASKAAIESMSATWAQELSATGVTVNVVRPGGKVDTGLFPDGGHGALIRYGYLAPSVMNGLVVWLLSDASDGVSGRRFNASLWDDSKVRTRCRSCGGCRTPRSRICIDALRSNKAGLIRNIKGGVRSNPASKGMTRRSRNKIALKALVLTIFSTLSTSAFSQADWPSRPVSVIVGYPAGSATDAAARVVTGPLAKKLGQPVIIENRGGADGMIAGRAIARSEPSGYTMGFSTTTSWALALNMQPQQMGFDPRKDFASVSLLGDTHYLLIVNADLGVNSVADLVALAKRSKAGSLNFSSTGDGSIAHLGMLIIAKKLGIEMTHVPYKSTAQSIVDVASGVIQLQLATISPRFLSCKPAKFVFWELPAIVGRR